MLSGLSSLSGHTPAVGAIVCVVLVMSACSGTPEHEQTSDPNGAPQTVGRRLLGVRAGGPQGRIRRRAAEDRGRAGASRFEGRSQRAAGWRPDLLPYQGHGAVLQEPPRRRVSWRGRVRAGVRPARRECDTAQQSVLEQEVRERPPNQAAVRELIARRRPRPASIAQMNAIRRFHRRGTRARRSTKTVSSSEAAPRTDERVSDGALLAPRHCLPRLRRGVALTEADFDSFAPLLVRQGS